MKVTIVFENDRTNTHKGQTFDAIDYEVHNSFRFLKLIKANGDLMHFNLDSIFSFTVEK